MARRVTGELGVEGGRDGDGEQGVGQRVPQARIGHHRGARLGLDVQSSRILDAGGYEGANRRGERGDAQGQGLAQIGVGEINVQARMHPVLFQRGDLARHLDEHAERRTHGEHSDADDLVDVEDLVKDEECGETRDDHDVIQHRGEIAPEVITMRIEHTREHRAQAIEQDLDGEKAEEVNRRVHLPGVGAHERLRPNHRRRADGGDNRCDAQHEQQNTEKIAHVLVARRDATFAAHLEVDRQERRDEHAADHKLIEHAWQVVGDLIGRREQGQAERGAHRPRAHEAGETAHQDEGGHHARRASSLLIVGLAKVVLLNGGVLRLGKLDWGDRLGLNLVEYVRLVKCIHRRRLEPGGRSGIA